MIATIGRQVLSIASMATVARILGPGAYGIMAMAVLVLLLVSILRDLGTGTAIIQRPEVNDRLLSSLFWLNFLSGLVIALTLIVASGLVARFFKMPALVPILCVLSSSFWLVSCGIVHNSLLMREMRFRTLAFCDLGAALIAYVTALACALSGLGVWSLVLANVTNSVVATVCYWIAAGWRPNWAFDTAELKSIMKFSLNLTGFVFLNYFNRNADNMIVGKFLGDAALGDYQMAYNLMLTPLQNVTSVVAQATFPSFSRIQNDLQRFRSAFVRECMLVGIISFPMMAGLGVVAGPLILVVLGGKWVGAIRIFKVLAPVGLMQSVNSLVGQIYTARGRTDLMFRWSIFAVTVCVTAFLVGVRFHALGVAAAYCIVYFGILMYPGFVIPFRLIDLKFMDFTAAIFPQLLITLLMASGCFVWLQGIKLIGINSPLFSLVTTSLLGLIAYVCMMVFLWPPVMGVLEGILGAYGNPGLKRIAGGVRRLAGSNAGKWFTCPAEIQHYLNTQTSLGNRAPTNLE